MPRAVVAQSAWVAKVRSWITANEQPVMRELQDLLAIPNVASDRANIRKNAEHLRTLFAKRGFSVELLETAGNPLVYAELEVPGAARTLLIYSHYDGQPVDPKGWQQPDPFKPVTRDGRIYARSASDDKSPIIMTLAAVDALRAAGATPTSNIRVVLDGEEEAGSPSLVPAITKYRDKLSADLMVILDGP
ncbi:MAG: M20/M25/M40 family metallo-hydrolase, partial [Acidobacteria bacterium]|nr:M20/M25/M40 family metallo-hydrolase [Acidobacteriota bacterium]